MKQLKIIAIVLAILIAGGNVFLFIRSRAADSTPPVLKVETDTLELSIEAESAEYLQGVSAWDQRDGDLSDQVFVEHISQLTGKGTVKATYAVFDAAGNAATASRTIHFTDYSGPEFSVSQPLRYHVSEVVTLLDRISAQDPYDGVITGQIRATNVSLNNDTEGIYRIEVQVTNSLGDTTILTLPVIIANDTNMTPQVKLSSYLVYLNVGDKFDAESYISSVSDPAEPEDSQPKKSAVKIESEVDTNTPGTYDVTYTLKGEEDDYQVILTVVVREQEGDAQ